MNIRANMPRNGGDWSSQLATMLTETESKDADAADALLTMSQM